MTFKELEKILTANGWYLYATKGSHKHYKNNSIPGKITIPRHGGDIKPGTLNAILKQANLKGEIK